MNNKKKKKLITTKRVFLAALLLAAVVFALYVVIAQSLASKTSRELTVQEAQTVVNERLASLPKAQADAAVYLTSNMSVIVKNVTPGGDRSLVLDCDVSTYDLYGTVEENLDKYLALAYRSEEHTSELQSRE